MTTIFDNYANISDSYIPTNTETINNDCSKLDPCKAKIPFADYNAAGELVGYWWYYGDTLNLEFTISGEVIVDQGTDETSTYTTAEDYLSDKQVKVCLYNFRMELIDTKVFDGATTITYEIDEELSKKLVKGVYYCSLSIYNGTGLIETLLGQSDCTLTVK